MSKQFTLSDIQPVNGDLLKDNLFLILVNPSNVPPHLMLSANNLLFSIDVKGTVVGKNSQQLILSLQRLQKECLFVQLVQPKILNPYEILDSIANLFRQYSRVISGETTCLAPIKTFCADYYATPTQNIQFVFELLPELEKQGLLQKTFHLNMEKYFIQTNSFELKTYTLQDVNNYILNSRVKPNVIG